MTRSEIENGSGLLASHQHTLIFQRGQEDCFETADRSAVPAPGWHLAGAGRLLADGETRIEWCDLR